MDLECTKLSEEKKPASSLSYDYQAYIHTYIYITASVGMV